jgi:hypothetical protein
MPDGVTTIMIDRRFRGPVASGNGGVSAGMAASFVEGPAAVRLRMPPPLETALVVGKTDDGVALMLGAQVVMEARPSHVPVAVPLEGAHLDDVLAQTFELGANEMPATHPAPECFVCGRRDDGLRIIVRNLPNTDIWSSVWTPDVSVASDGRFVDGHVVWGVLDCPAGMAVVHAPVSGELPFFPALVRLTASLGHPVAVGEPVAVLGWNEPSGDGRDNAGTAIVDRDGRVLAHAYAEHARLPIDFAM